MDRRRVVDLIYRKLRIYDSPLRITSLIQLSALVQAHVTVAHICLYIILIHLTIQTSKTRPNCVFTSVSLMSEIDPSNFRTCEAAAVASPCIKMSKMIARR